MSENVVSRYEPLNRGALRQIALRLADEKNEPLFDQVEALVASYNEQDAVDIFKKLRADVGLIASDDFYKGQRPEKPDPLYYLKEEYSRAVEKDWPGKKEGEVQMRQGIAAFEEFNTDRLLVLLYARKLLRRHDADIAPAFDAIIGPCIEMLRYKPRFVYAMWPPLFGEWPRDQPASAPPAPK